MQASGLNNQVEARTGALLLHTLHAEAETLQANAQRVLEIAELCRANEELQRTKDAPPAPKSSLMTPRDQGSADVAPRAAAPAKSKSSASQQAQGETISGALSCLVFGAIQSCASVSSSCIYQEAPLVG